LITCTETGSDSATGTDSGAYFVTDSGADSVTVTGWDTVASADSIFGTPLLLRAGYDSDSGTFSCSVLITVTDSCTCAGEGLDSGLVMVPCAGSGVGSDSVSSTKIHSQAFPPV
jgi:hypothetical protein